MKDTQLRLVYHERKLSAPIICSKDSFNFFLKVWDKSLINLTEQVYIIYLNANNEVICWRCLCTGDGCSCPFNVKLAVCCGLTCMASKAIIAHNHPSGNLEPSKEDIFVTNKIYRAFGLIDVSLIDHIVISRCGYYSFVDRGIKIE